VQGTLKHNGAASIVGEAGSTPDGSHSLLHIFKAVAKLIVLLHPFSVV
jgi:hypothetical protein